MEHDLQPLENERGNHEVGIRERERGARAGQPEWGGRRARPFAGKLEPRLRLGQLQGKCQLPSILPARRGKREEREATVTTPPAEIRARRKTCSMRVFSQRMKRIDVHS